MPQFCRSSLSRLPPVSTALISLLLGGRHLQNMDQDYLNTPQMEKELEDERKHNTILSKGQIPNREHRLPHFCIETSPSGAGLEPTTPHCCIKTLQCRRCLVADVPSLTLTLHKNVRSSDVRRKSPCWEKKKRIKILWDFFPPFPFILSNSIFYNSPKKIKYVEGNQTWDRQTDRRNGKTRERKEKSY